ncbi:MAG TPA: DSD1 family PLP-dependent enzyme [Firmicutes bacterium]|nr:DSD1 family PLP-dependent enzyme [Candidatus Fermentithermobacillaceae bacterium]
MNADCKTRKTGPRREMIGRPVEDVETPALVVDLDIMEQNMDKMMSFLRKGTVGIRPHAKTHKTPEIALLQMAKGALGITAAKVGEAEAMADGGVKDIMIASQIVGEGKIKRVVELSKRIDLKVAVDSMDNLKDISAASQAGGGNVGIVIELEVGNQRCGVSDPDEAVLLAKAASELPGVWFAGIMGYEGHCVFMGDFEARKEAAKKAYDAIFAVRDHIKAKTGLDCGIVSTGGTGTYMIAGLLDGFTDIEAGSYIFMDLRYGSTPGVDFQQSLTVLSTIVSHPKLDLWVCDAGLKSMTREFGLVSTLPSYGIKPSHMSEEHIKLEPNPNPDPLPSLAELDRKYAQGASREFKVGDKLHLIPSHCCTTVNLHDVIYAVRNGVVEDVWAVTGRGKFA